MKKLQIKAYLKHGRIIINDELPFDGILYHQFSKEQKCSDYYWNDYNTSPKVNENYNISTNLGKIIKIHSTEQLESYNPTTGEIYIHNNKNAGVFLASAGIYNAKKIVVEKIRKRFEEQKFEKWGYAKNKLYTTMGEFKNYDIKREVVITPYITWVVIGDKKKIEEMLSKITHIGKERNIGYGEVEKWEVKEKDMKGWRYFPSKHFAPCEKQEYRRVHPPYHIHKNKLLCSKRFF